MSDRIPRAKMLDTERRIRSRLARLVANFALVRGSIQQRERACGKPNCRCAQGEKHSSIYLVARDEGKYQQLFIPKALEPHARRWAQDYQEARDLLEQLSKLCWDRLKRREP
ncbi:MAG: hypothetical protein GY842_09930 [bacterium]|nr:hypothetical protein [bacterium]